MLMLSLVKAEALRWGWGVVNSCFGVWPNSMICVSLIFRSFGSWMLTETKQGQQIVIIIITGVISTGLYFTDKGEHTILYKINKNVLVKTSNRINNHIVLLIHNTPPHTHTHTHTRVHRRNVTGRDVCVCVGGGNKERRQDLKSHVVVSFVEGSF